MIRTLRGSPAIRALRWLWALSFSLVFIAAGLLLACVGSTFTVAGVQAVLEPNDAGHAAAGMLFAVLGLAAVVVCVWPFSGCARAAC